MASEPEMTSASARTSRSPDRPSHLTPDSEGDGLNGVQEKAPGGRGRVSGLYPLLQITEHVFSTCRGEQNSDNPDEDAGRSYFHAGLHVLEPGFPHTSVTASQTRRAVNTDSWSTRFPRDSSW